MLAARLHGPRDLRIDEVEEPTPGRGETKIRVEFCGICGSDLHLYHGDGLPAGESIPQIIGHEFSGTVIEVGGGSDAGLMGARVVVRPTVSCGECWPCRAGMSNVCRSLRFYGVSPLLPGGMAQYVVVDASHVHRLPESVSLLDGALVEPLAVGQRAVNRGAVPASGAATVFGAGPIGLSVVLGLQSAGVERIFVVEPAATRRETLAELAGVEVIDPAGLRIHAEILRRTDGRGVDTTFECAGRPEILPTALRCTARQGKIVLVALYSEPVALEAFYLLSTEQSITASLAYTPEDFAGVIQNLGNGRYPTDDWVRTVGLGEIQEQGFDALEHQNDTKILVRPWA